MAVIANTVPPIQQTSILKQEYSYYSNTQLLILQVKRRNNNKIVFFLKNFRQIDKR